MNPEIRKGLPGWGSTGFPESTASDAGYLVADSSGWRDRDPAVDLSKCTGCGICYKYCPDGAVSILERKAVLDLRFCKGCGICVRMCPAGAISMEARQ